MKILIVEDETLAYENLAEIVRQISSEYKIIGNAESVSQTISWLEQKERPDLILMDIHLSDGSAFEIFKHSTVEIPIIFTTAFDQYAIDAFKVNSVDYLLKPIKPEELKRALDKFNKWTKNDALQYMAGVSQISSSNTYSKKILVPIKDKLLPIDLSGVACFYTSNKNTQIILRDGSSFPYSRSLEQINSTLNPNKFFRANKQFIVARKSVKEITIWFDNRLLVDLDIDMPERLYVSKNRAVMFKQWMINGEA